MSAGGSPPGCHQQALGGHRLATVQVHDGVGVLEGQAVHGSGYGEWAPNLLACGCVACQLEAS